MMRLLHVTHQYYPAIGGSERYITDLSETLVRRGHEVTVFTSQSRDYHTWENVLPPREQINGVAVYRFPSLRRGPLAWKLLEIGLRNYSQFRSPMFAPHIFIGNGPLSPQLFAALLRHAGEFDLVHINQLHYAHAWTAYLATQPRRRPLVVTPHIHVEQPATYDVGYLWRILRHSDTVLAVTRAEQQFLQHHLPDHQVTLGGNGLNLAAFPPRNQQQSRQCLELPADAFVILFLGRKTEYKGLEQVIEAFVRLRQHRDDVYMLAVGPETTYSEHLWAQIGPCDGLIVRGTVSDDERLHALAACDVLALPSTGEAFGIVYLEAWAYAKPVIGANIQSVASLIEDGVDGFVVEAHQPGSLLRVLMTLVNDPALAATMGRAGQRKLYQHYTTERITDVVEGACLRLLRRMRTETGSKWTTDDRL